MYSTIKGSQTFTKEGRDKYMILECLLSCDKENDTTCNMSLIELENEVYKITKKQNYISNCGLSMEIVTIAVKELQEHKNKLLKLMHKKIDEL